MKLRNFIFAAAAMVFAVSACEKEETNLGTPDISISVSEMDFEIAGGDQTLTVSATRDWKVEADADWVVVSPASGKASADAQTVTVSVLENEGMDREASLKFTIGMKSKYLTVSQLGPKGSPADLILYSNNFDKEEATKTYGSKGTSWPYLDQFDGWKNATGKGAANVTYGFSGMSTRANSVSSGEHSNYPGSGKNNMFFGSSAYFAVKNVALGGETNLELTFGTEKYSQDNGSVFTNSEFHIWLSNDGAKWVEFTDYTFAGGTTEGKWNIASASFSVPEGTANLSICMQVDVASSYRLDDLQLAIAAEAGEVVDFANAVAKDFNGTGSTGGGSTGGGSSDVEVPENAIFFESFSAGQGDFTIENKTLPASATYIWKHDSAYGMVASAYINKANYASESWLISPEIDLTNVSEAYLSYDQACNFFASTSVLPQQAAVLVSKDGGEWTALTPEYPGSMSWSFLSSGEMSLESFVGGKIKIAFKYVSTDEKAGTWEVKNVLVASAKAVGPTLPEGLTGDGTEANPFTVADVHTIYNAGIEVRGWVTGPIVGVVKTGNNPLQPAEGTDVNTNLAIGTEAQFLPVQLPSGDLRTALNLVDNPGNLGKTLVINANIEAYFQMAGLKSPTEYRFAE